MLSLKNPKTQTLETLTKEGNDPYTLYFCGPTVYSRLHIGNLRALFVADLLVRTLRRHRPVIFARNITDIDDKIINEASRQNISIEDLVEKTISLYHQDTQTLGLIQPDYEPRATHYIPQMITMIEKIIDHDAAYLSQGHVFFKHDKLSEELFSRPCGCEEHRVTHDYGQKNDADFVLWKPSQSHEPGWESPWGRGRPGWHIECSAMTYALFGENFDLHGGGSDLEFPHHANEIRQNKAAFPGSQFAKHWIHSGMLTINGKKMSKSIGNTVNLDRLIETLGSDGVRLLFLMTHYASNLNMSEERFSEIKTIYKKLSDKIAPIWTPYEGEIDHHLLKSLDTDLNTSEIFTQWNTATPEDILKSGQILGLFHEKPKEKSSSLSQEDIENALHLRDQARKEKNWGESDRIRNFLADHNIALQDTPEGQKWSYKT